MFIIPSKNLKLRFPFQNVVKHLQLGMIGGLCIISQPIESMAAGSIQTNSNRQQSLVSNTKLRNTLWGQVARRHGIDPYILYAVALTESQKNDGQNRAVPSPWAINNAGNTFIPGNQQEAEALLYQLMVQGKRNIDIGIMQVNLRWHGHRVTKPEQLLDPSTNLEIGARVLSDAIQSAPNNLALGIGRYYSWKNEPAAIQYGQKVIALADQIRAIL
ncbi:transglycosylase SLT domain-containing protein [Methylomonas sp. UP202]|uniref:transglycosylase SLT domain-containing protein n=1 Tax=Methylomonas sp. UP202 TaxID=3040943 RepID=UPI0024789AC8|nr:transglycosylase SLT domain-containing protein [Methylomonas sp. UP202]WGS83857.1 transglycosylase SLT domain-containing protein [Methylomonas sp. UP202]